MSYKLLDVETQLIASVRLKANDYSKFSQANCIYLIHNKVIAFHIFTPEITLRYFAVLYLLLAAVSYKSQLRYSIE